MATPMNIMQYVYTDKAAQKVAKELDMPYRELMHTVIHDLMCIKDSDARFSPLRFRVINGEPYAEWVEHTPEEWTKLLNETTLIRVEGTLEAIIIELRKGLRGDNDK